jgi:hypothetical protein
MPFKKQREQHSSNCPHQSAQSKQLHRLYQDHQPIFDHQQYMLGPLLSGSPKNCSKQVLVGKNRKTRLENRLGPEKISKEAALKFPSVQLEAESRAAKKYATWFH